jgi:hypothetical protein
VKLELCGATSRTKFNKSKAVGGFAPGDTFAVLTRFLRAPQLWALSTTMTRAVSNQSEELPQNSKLMNPVNRAMQTVPEKYQGKQTNKIERSIRS